jgi:hypothetical protein
LALRGTELVELTALALDFEVVKFGDDHTPDESCEGIEFIEPHAPELRNLGLGDSDTAEEGEDDLHLELVYASFDRCEGVLTIMNGLT